MSYQAASWPSLLPLIAAVCSLCIALMMLMMCLFMYTKQRKKAYIYMAAAFFFIMTYEGLNIHSALGTAPALGATSATPQALQLFSFALLNTAVLLLYRRMKKRHFWMPLLFTLAILALLILPAVLPFPVDPLWQKVSFDLMHGAVIVLCLLRIPKKIGQPVKYTIGLLTYAVWAAMKTASGYGLTMPPALNNTVPFLPVVFYAIVFFVLFRRIVELMQSIYRSSITDGLTGLYNRKHFTKHLEQYVEQQLKIAVIFCDIDNFKKLNDTQGHAKADEVLQQVAAIMQEELDGLGLTGRYGGEELVALVVDRKVKPAQVAESIRARVASETIVTISVGFSVLRQGVQGDELMKQADQAMYRSKTTGKNKVTDYRSMKEASPKSKEAAAGSPA
ncbi:GGDEF domain-containing protein [Paenibacillus sp. FSL M8-0334]|uniref:Diguanylate cyclase n=1 Tax=Paenibacillus campinasensis TaxID=66347 RepID=A0ABW9SYJ9_9BACL|nr:GGDEF domain-containing protein [Paenibacillus campinasensis]MUG65532.1 diguanylate cyclase [Paenibacillus campinasensis]